MILGIDEAGRGPWAGPLVVGAVVLGGEVIDGLTDSKKLTKKKRQQLYEEITLRAKAYASGWVSAGELDEIGMSAALRLATRRAVAQVRVPYSEIIIDGTINFLSDTGKGKYTKTMPKADLLIPSVSAASVVAKVERDRYMEQLDAKHPGYGFGSHAGYGTAKHREAIDKNGVTPEHRLSFAPLKKYADVSGDEAVVVESSLKVTSKTLGDKAETKVVEYLESLGHVLVERNWRTRYCEIDIITKKNNTLYFTEVKYRKSGQQGGGLAAITKAKLRQMKFAAELYEAKKTTASDMILAVADVTGDNFTVAQWFEIV